jgi:hypothetical protein
LKLLVANVPNSKTTFIDFDGQFHSNSSFGRNNAEGVELSMAQWYPKLAELILKVGMLILISPENFTVFGKF